MVQLFVLLLMVLLIICDINYVLRTLFVVLSGRIYEKTYTLDEVTTIFGIGTFQDSNICFRHVRLARLVRELDFARYHYYDRTGIYRRSKQLGIKSLQGSTEIISMEPIPLFQPYRINTKLVYWDDRSLFFEHEVITIYDDRVRCLLISRQYAIGNNNKTTAELLKDLPGSETAPGCPENIQKWLHSMQISSANLRKTHNYYN